MVAKTRKAEQKIPLRQEKNSGADALRACLENAGQSMDESCPVAVLGTNNGTYYFISPLGEVRKFSEQQMNEAGIQGLFGGDLAWLQAYFPIEPGKGKAQTGCEFNVAAVRVYLISRCYKKEIFDDSAPVRSVGVWKNKSGEMPIVHCGNTVLINGAWVKSGFYEGGIIYPAAPAVTRPADNPATTQECREILAGLECWNFELPQGPELALGLLGQAFIAGALDWKAHALFYGPQGSGKTTLARYISAALGSMAHTVANNYTEAGLRQGMSNQARAVLLDEMEADGAYGAMKPVIRMLRQMSSSEGANIRRGTPGGHAQNFRLNGCVMMFCILPPHMEPQDRARIARLKLLPLKLQDNASFNEKQMIRRAQELAPKLFCRAISRAEHFAQACASFKAHLAAAKNLTSRAADQLAAILAGADIFLFNYPPEEADSFEERMEFIQPLIDEWSMDEEENEGQQCLTRLYSSPLNVYSRDENKTIGSVILEALDAQEGKFAREALKQVGILAKDYHTDNHYIMIANNHEGLHRIFRGSKWEGGGWVTSLRYLPGSGSTKNAVRFAGTQMRATIIPAQHLPAAGE